MYICKIAQEHTPHFLNILNAHNETFKTFFFTHLKARKCFQRTLMRCKCTAARRRDGKSIWIMDNMFLIFARSLARSTHTFFYLFKMRPRILLLFVVVYICTVHLSLGDSMSFKYMFDMEIVVKCIFGFALMRFLRHLWCDVTKIRAHVIQFACR